MDAEPRKRSKRLWTWMSLVIAVCLILIAASLGYFGKRMAPVLSQKLKNRVVRASKGLYHIEFSQFTVNFFSGTIALRDFRLIPDTVVYQQMKALHQAPENLFDLTVPVLSLRHAHPIRLVVRKQIKVGDVDFEYPIVRIAHEDLLPHDSVQSVKKALASLISGSLKAIAIGRLELNNGSFSYRNNSQPLTGEKRLDGVDVILRDLTIDSTSFADTSRILYARECWVHLMNLGLATPDSLYRLKIGDLTWSAARGDVLIQGLTLQPRYSDAAFDRKVGMQTDRFDLRVDSLAISGLDLQSLLREKKIGRLGRVDLRGVNADIYHNRELPARPGIRSMPQQALRDAGRHFVLHDIATQFTVDSLSLARTQIIYRERSPESNRVGTVSFNQLNGLFRHLSNDSVVLAANPHCTGDVEALFMDRGKARVHFDLNLTDPADAFAYSGSLGPMKASVLNKATRYLGLLTIRSGNIHRLTFNFQANAQSTRGQVGLRYDELSIKILSLDELSGRLKKKGLASLVANLLVLNNNNITDTAAPHSAQVTYVRDPQKSVFNLMWKSLFTGVKQIVGMQDASHVKQELQQNTLIQKIQQKKQQKQR